MVNRKIIIYKDYVYCDNCSGMYSYRMLIVIQGYFTGYIYIVLLLCIFWDRKKYLMDGLVFRLRFQAA